MGLTGAFDKFVVEAVIERLRHRRDVQLGCNISGLSAKEDNWWMQLFPSLLADPALANRLVLEITETARPFSLQDATHFVELARYAGCRVALDDFGAEFSSIGFARDAQFDVIKIDGSYLRNGIGTEFSRSLLDLLVELAGAISTDVVVEGIESQADKDAASAAGAVWLQGFYIGKPVPFSSTSVSASPNGVLA